MFLYISDFGWYIVSFRRKKMFTKTKMGGDMAMAMAWLTFVRHADVTPSLSLSLVQNKWYKKLKQIQESIQQIYQMTQSLVKIPFPITQIKPPEKQKKTNFLLLLY